MNRKAQKNVKQDGQTDQEELRIQIAAVLEKDDIEDVQGFIEFTKRVLDVTGIEDIKSPEHAKQMLDLGNLCTRGKLYDNAIKFAILARKYGKTRGEADVLLKDLGDLQSSSDQCYPELMDKKEAEEEPPLAEKFKRPGKVASPTSRAAILRKKKIKEFTEQDIDNIRQMIDDEQDRSSETKEEKEQFVEDVRLMLLASKHIIRLKDGTEVTLTVAPGGSGKGCIQFQVVGGRRSNLGFIDKEFAIVPKSRQAAKHQLKASLSSQNKPTIL